MLTMMMPQGVVNLRGEGVPLDEIEHEDPWLRVHDARTQACQMGRLARSQLVSAHNPMHRDIAAHPHDIAATAIFDGEVLVGDAAGERARLDVPDPDLKRGDAGQ
jgi:hypothetical protein